MQGARVQSLAGELDPTYCNQDLVQLNIYIFLMPLDTGKCPLGANEPLDENPYSILRSSATLFMKPFPELLRSVNGFYTLCNNLLAFNIASFQLDLYVFILPSPSGHKFLEGRDHLLFIYKPIVLQATHYLLA